MNDILLILLGIAIFSLGIWVLTTQEKRVERKIYKDALKNGIVIKEIREPILTDGKNPLSKSRIVVGLSSNIFGFRGERMFFKIIKTKKSKYWVRVDTLFFTPSKVEWSEEIFTLKKTI